MNEVIYKAALDVTALQTINIQQGAEIISCASQKDFPVVWYRCHPDMPLVRRRIAIVATGGQWIDNGKYVGTVLLFDGALVWHIFDMGEVS